LELKLLEFKKFKNLNLKKLKLTKLFNIFIIFLITFVIFSCQIGIILNKNQNKLFAQETKEKEKEKTFTGKINDFDENKDFDNSSDNNFIYCDNDNSQVKNGSKLPFVFPLNGKININFREEYKDLDKKTIRKHTGIDISGEFNQNVIAAGNGIVTYVGFSPIGGRTIVIEHNEKIKTTYLNLLSVFVTNGDYVKQGQIIATIGAKDDPSNLSDYHLHFGVIYNDLYLDPVDLLSISYKSISKYISLDYLNNDFYVK